MAETKQKKGFNVGVYSVFAGVIIAVILVVLTIFAFATRYTAFSPEKVAQSYTDTIVQTGDGYNAYKISLVSKNSKYGDFIRATYMAPYVNEDAEQAAFVGTGSEEEQNAIDTVYDTMYDYYIELLMTYGFDDYDAVFSNYFAKLKEVRNAVYGDEFMNTDFMFGAFESNVDTYGKSLTGTEEQVAQDGKTVLQEATVGKYQEMYGEDYKLTSVVTSCEELTGDDASQYIAEYSERITVAIDKFTAGINVDDAEKAQKMKDTVSALNNAESISAVAKCVVDVTLEDGSTVATQEIYVVEIGNSWYVDNTNIDTTALYLALGK